MWMCPKCGRTFKRKEQSHYCGKAPETVDEYIAAQPEEVRVAGFKNHVGLYPGPEAVREFSERLKDFKTSKGTIQLPYSRPVPAELVSDIARWCYETGNHP